LKRLHSRPVNGRREGQRMPLEGVQRCLRLPDRTTIQGKRDYAILGILFACGLRRAELCNLKVDTIGPLNGGVIFRAIRKNGKVWGNGLDESAIWEIVRHYAAQVGHPNFAPTTPAAPAPVSTTTPRRRSSRFIGVNPNRETVFIGRTRPFTALM
jgi:integrase